jgi:hypothetical protein
MCVPSGDWCLVKRKKAISYLYKSVSNCYNEIFPLNYCFRKEMFCECICIALIFNCLWYALNSTTLIHILWIRHLFLSYALNNVMLLTVVMLNLQTDLAQHNLFTKTLHNWGSNYLNSSSGLFSIDPSDLLLQLPSNSAFTC